MDELIARIESATEGNYALDRDITEAISGRGIWHYTTSIDAALTLVPDGWWAEIFARPDQPSCILWEFHMPCRRIPSKRPYVHAGKSVPLALCAAALRARQAAS